MSTLVVAYMSQQEIDQPISDLPLAAAWMSTDPSPTEMVEVTLNARKLEPQIALKFLVAPLLRIANLGDNWDFEHARKPSRTSVRLALHFAASLSFDPDLPLPKIYPGVNGEIVFEWEHETSLLNATIGEVPNSSDVVYFFERENESEEWQSPVIPDHRFDKRLNEFSEANCSH